MGVAFSTSILVGLVEFAVAGFAECFEVLAAKFQLAEVELTTIAALQTAAEERLQQQPRLRGVQPLFALQSYSVASVAV